MPVDSAPKFLSAFNRDYSLEYHFNVYTFINKVWDVGDFKPILTTNDKIHHRMVMKEHRIPQSNFHNTVHDGCHRNLVGHHFHKLACLSNQMILNRDLLLLLQQFPSNFD